MRGMMQEMMKQKQSSGESIAGNGRNDGNDEDDGTVRWMMESAKEPSGAKRNQKR